MALHSSTTRILLAFALPLCCCRISAAAVCCSPAGPPDATASRTLNDHVHDGHHHDHGDQHQHRDEAPADDQPPSPASPCDHDESCDCGCDETRTRVVEKSVTIDYPVLAVAAISWISPVATVRRPSIRPFAIGATRPCTSLVRMHCALIV